MFWTYAAAGLAALANVVVLGFSLRRLSPGEFGTYAIVVTITQLLTILDFALSTPAVRAAAAAATARSGEERSTSLRTIRAVHACNLLLTGLLLSVTGVSCVLAASLGKVDLAGLILLLGASISLSTLTAVLLGVATGGRCFRRLAIATVAGLTVSVVVTVLFIGRYGMVILGCAELGRVIVSRALIASWIKPLGRLDLPALPSWASLREIAAPAWSLLAISAAGLAVSSTDVLLLGVFSGSGAAGAYRIGSLLPAQVTGLLFRGYDAAFPLLAGQRDTALQTDVTRLLTRFFSIMAAAGLGAVALQADVVVRLLSGRSETLSRWALVAFCIVWAVNVVIHGPALHLLSRGGQSILARVVLTELVLNVALTVVLIVVVGPVGAALASLFAVTASNLVLAPWVMRRLLGAEVGKTVWVTGLAGLLAGAASAGAGRLAASPLSGSAARMSVALVVAAAGGVVAFTVLSPKEERRLLAGSLKRRIEQSGGAPVPGDAGAFDQ